MTNKYTKRTEGFTLVELSIVIIIIGFLIAGVAAGQSLIKQSQLNSVINQIASIRSAFNQFKVVYDGKPGDFIKAYAYWGAAAGCTDADVNVDPDGCNGNGDNLVSPNGGPPAESYLMWKHLNLAGLLPGSYSGKLTAASWDQGAGIDYPASAIPSSGIGVTCDTYWGLFAFQDQLGFGRGGYFPVLKPVEAQQIDLKLDDGLPKTGIALAGNPTGGDFTCLNGGWPENLGGANEYKLDYDSPACRMIFTLNYSKDND